MGTRAHSTKDLKTDILNASTGAAYVLWQRDAGTDAEMTSLAVYSLRHGRHHTAQAYLALTLRIPGSRPVKILKLCMRLATTRTAEARTPIQRSLSLRARLGGDAANIMWFFPDRHAQWSFVYSNHPGRGFPREAYS